MRLVEASNAPGSMEVSALYSRFLLIMYDPEFMEWLKYGTIDVVRSFGKSVTKKSGNAWLTESVWPSGGRKLQRAGCSSDCCSGLCDVSSKPIGRSTTTHILCWLLLSSSYNSLNAVSESKTPGDRPVKPFDSKLLFSLAHTFTHKSEP